MFSNQFYSYASHPQSTRLRSILTSSFHHVYLKIPVSLSYKWFWFTLKSAYTILTRKTNTAYRIQLHRVSDQWTDKRQIGIFKANPPHIWVNRRWDHAALQGWTLHDSFLHWSNGRCSGNDEATKSNEKSTVEKYWAESWPSLEYLNTVPGIRSPTSHGKRDMISCGYETTERQGITTYLPAQIHFPILSLVESLLSLFFMVFYSIKVGKMGWHIARMLQIIYPKISREKTLA
jgi:hypothetical protein